MVRALEIEFPCVICETPAKPDRIDGRCNSCLRKTCASCSRQCSRCMRIFCQDDVQERTVMIQQVQHSKLLCENCRRVLLL